MKSRKIVYIEGNIGAGKSTLINFLGKYDFIKTHYEPINKWKNFNNINLFNLSTEDPLKYSFLFQMYVTLTMLQRQLFNTNENKINVMERSVLTSKKIFMKVYIKNKLMESPFSDFFNEWFQFIQENHQIQPKYIIYLRTTPKILLKRIQQRGRLEEKKLSLRFLQQLHHQHEKYIMKMRKKCKILTINCNEKLNQEKLNKILNFIIVANKKK